MIFKSRCFDLNSTVKININKYTSIKYFYGRVLVTYLMEYKEVMVNPSKKKRVMVKIGCTMHAC